MSAMSGDGGVWPGGIRGLVIEMFGLGE